MRLLAHFATISLAALIVAGCTDANPVSSPMDSHSAALIPLPGPRPGPFPPGTDFADITAGDNHTCARKNNNTVFCWGLDNNGQSGSWTTRTCSGIACVDRPTILNVQTPEGGRGTLTSTKIDAGGNHTCIIDTLNDAYCWGDGNNGQVGFAQGSYSSIFEATKVAGGLKFSVISAGGQSTCAAGSTGIYCWGMIANRAATPSIVSGYGYSLGLAVGSLHACVMDGARTIDCWGSNSYGQLSIDRAAVTYSSAILLSNFGPSSRVVSQSYFTCADQLNGTIQCAGENTYGQLANGQSGSYTSTGTPQTVGGSSQLHGVTTGNQHACALDAGGSAYCWGNGYNGQVGSGSSNYFTSPQLVGGGHTYRALAAGGQHTCGIGTDNHIYCWGQNQYGQLGTQYPGGWVWSPVQALDPVL
jgi:alpha-tubulin suppressor-like RCC1 family protein